MNSLLCILDREQDRNLESSLFWRIKQRTCTENFPQGPSKFLSPMQLTAQLRCTPEFFCSCSTLSLGTCEWNTSHFPALCAKQQMASKPSFTSHKTWSSHGAMHGPQKKKYFWAYLLSTRGAKAPSYEAKPRPCTIFRKNIIEMGKRNQKAVPS